MRLYVPHWTASAVCPPRLNSADVAARVGVGRDANPPRIAAVELGVPFFAAWVGLYIENPRHLWRTLSGNVASPTPRLAAQSVSAAEDVGG